MDQPQRVATAASPSFGAKFGASGLTRSAHVRRTRAASARLIALAQRPLWTCPKCGRGFVTANLWHSCDVGTVDEFFVNHTHLRPVFDAYVRFVETIRPFTVEVRRISFVTRPRFAVKRHLPKFGVPDGRRTGTRRVAFRPDHPRVLHRGRSRTTLLASMPRLCVLMCDVVLGGTRPMDVAQSPMCHAYGSRCRPLAPSSTSTALRPWYVSVGDIDVGLASFGFDARSGYGLSGENATPWVLPTPG